MAALLLGSPAQAEPPDAGSATVPEPSEAAKSPSSSWYGGQILAVDAATFALGGGGVAVLASDLPKGAGLGIGLPMLTVAAFSYVFASPIVHAMHGHVVDPEKDPTMRNAASARIAGLLGGLGVGAFTVLGYAASGARPSSEGAPAATIVSLTALGLGLTIPIVLDVALFAYEPRKHALGVNVSPTGASLSGTFD